MKDIPSPVDFHRFSEIRDLFGEETCSLYEEFFSELPEHLESLHRSIHLREFQQVELTAHSLSGSSGSIGALYVEKVARGLERRAHGENLNDAGRVLLRLEVEIARLRHFLEERGLIPENSDLAA
ncbi:MAG: Hpt domain-containing protein [Planctomycetota bacterium]|nr:Hpt domain-containing protein [Planctomycetota bacterium]MDP6941369.1 Hpt domain-containing protein [Planctomycetota bacterium]